MFPAIPWIIAFVEGFSTLAVEVIAIRLAGQKLQYDERAMRFTNSDEANRWLNPPYRSGWTLT